MTSISFLPDVSFGLLVLSLTVSVFVFMCEVKSPNWSDESATASVICSVSNPLQPSLPVDATEWSLSRCVPPDIPVADPIICGRCNSTHNRWTDSLHLQFDGAVLVRKCTAARSFADPDHTGIPNTLQRRHNESSGVSNHQPYDCLLNHLSMRRSKKTSNLRVTGLCEGNSPVTGEFPAQRAGNAENVSIWWRHLLVQCVPVLF